MTDNYDLWEAHEARLERELAKFPVCAYCGESEFKKNTNDYIE